MGAFVDVGIGDKDMRGKEKYVCIIKKMRL